MRRSHKRHFNDHHVRRPPPPPPRPPPARRINSGRPSGPLLLPVHVLGKLRRVFRVKFWRSTSESSRNIVIAGSRSAVTTTTTTPEQWIDARRRQKKVAWKFYDYVRTFFMTRRKTAPANTGSVDNTKRSPSQQSSHVTKPWTRNLSIVFLGETLRDSKIHATLGFCFTRVFILGFSMVERYKNNYSKNRYVRVVTWQFLIS